MGVRTPELLHAIHWQHIHRSPFPQVTVPAGPGGTSCVRAGCGTFLLYSRRRRSRCHQLEAPVQGVREALHRRPGRVAGTALDPADISLRDASQAGQLSLRQAAANAGIAELKPQGDTGGEHRPHGSSLRSVRSLGLGEIVAEPGPHTAPPCRRLKHNTWRNRPKRPLEPAISLEAGLP